MTSSDGRRPRARPWSSPPRSRTRAVIMGVHQVGHSLKAELGVLETYDMTLEMAVAKLMWALAQTKDPAEVTRYFYTPVANDILRVPGESL
ncbi:MAG: hypothetical protein ACLUNZ_12020 [Evtepia sp.]